MLRLHHILLVLLPIVFLITYQVSLVDLYAYTGMMRPIATDFMFWCFFIVSMAAVVPIFPARIERPSDLFLFFYLLISVLWLPVMWPGTGLLSVDQAALLFTIIYLPALFLVVVRQFAYRKASVYLLPVQIGSEKYLLYILLLLLSMGAIIGYQTVGGGSLNWEEMYSRRVAGRLAFRDNLFSAYITGMATNGALPLVGFFAGYRRSVKIAAVCAAFIILMFFLLGLKSPAINFAGLALLGFCLGSHWLRHRFVPVALACILVVYSVGLLAVVAANNTFLADYLMRRISMVQPQLQSYFFDFWVHGGLDGFKAYLSGQEFSDITYMIGYLYFKNPATNANTSTFIYGLVRGGIAEYIITVISVASIFILMDVFYKKTKSIWFFSVAGLFSILISEQVWTTALATSGIALCLVLITLFSYSPTRNISDMQDA